MDLKKIEREGDDWTHLAQDSVHWQLNFQFNKSEEFLDQLNKC
jgi:hypothetical protein